ncbi:MAG TPA: diacylglycerol kinase family protein [Patescibacteria group bacterium]
MKKIHYILNPLSNEGRSIDIWKQTQRRYTFLPKNPIILTEIKDLEKFFKENPADIIAVAGGDGTINSVTSALINRKIKPKIAVLPFGFGNAISYCLGVETMAKAMNVLKKQQDAIAIDIMQTNITDKPHGMFNISMGFDARVVYNRMKDRYIGFRSYIVSAAKSFITHPEKLLTFIVDNKFVVNATASSLVIANSPIIGHNYVIASEARLNDGFLDCTLFSSKFAYLTNLRLKGFKHPLYSELGKVHFKAKSIKIDGDPFIQIDGDPFVRQGGIEITVKPSAIHFLRNDINKIDAIYKPFIL